MRQKTKGGWNDVLKMTQSLVERVDVAGKEYAARWKRWTQEEFIGGRSEEGWMMWWSRGKEITGKGRCGVTKKQRKRDNGER